MSNSKLIKYIDKAVDLPCCLKYVPFVITDSKGKYLQNLSFNASYKNSINWRCKSGASSRDTADWLSKNLEKVKTDYGKVSIYIWIGTCDFTIKKSKFISLVSDPNAALVQFKDSLEKIKTLCIEKDIRVTFVHIPYYSIEIWNRTRKHRNPETFKDQDKQLTKLIDEANTFIDHINSSLHTSSAKLNIDITRSRKKVNCKGRYTINFSLFKDGIHPGKILASAWLVSFARIIVRDCV